MKNKGFTLIELLAIIVILAIIALITLPVVKNVINQAKEKTAINSAYGFKDALHDYYINSTLDDETELEGIYRISDGMIDGPNLSNVSIKVKGTKPTAGKVIYKNGNILTACLEINGYKIKYNDEQFTSEGKGSCAASAANFATDSWAEIKFNLEADREAYPIGSLKTVKMNITGTEKDYTFRLINTSHPTECDNVNVAGNLNYSQSSCGVIIEFVTIIENRVMDTSNNGVGYSLTPLRAHLNTDVDSIYNSLPDDLKDIIIDTSPLITGGKNQTLYTYGEKLFPLSSREISARGYSTSEHGYNYTRPLDYYAKLGSTNNPSNERVKYTQSGITSSAGEYWLRTSIYDNTGSYERVKSNGEVWNASYSSSIGVAPAFRIAE